MFRAVKRERGGRRRTRALGEPLSEINQVVVGTWNHLHGDHFAHAFGGFCTGVDGRFEGGDITAEESGDVTGADRFVASHRDIGRLERSVRGLEQRAEAFGFDHSESFLSHGRNF